jgi:DNA transposition AAA+ family ATPase
MTESNRQVVERFGAWLKVQGLSQAEGARLVGCSPATLSQVLSDQYKGDTERYVEKMSRALAREDRRAGAPKAPGFASTSVVQEILPALRTAHDEGVMVVVMGDSGVGKTEACRCYCQAEPETILVTVPPAGPERRGRSVRPVLMDLMSALGLTAGLNAGTADLVQAIGRKLQGSGRLIIVDEIDYADESLLQPLRHIHDLAGCGIAMVATPAFVKRLRARRSATINQVLNRLADVVQVGTLTEDDVDLLLEGFGLDKAAQAAARLGAHGVARRLVHGIKRAQRLAQGGKLDAGTIGKAFSTLMEV